ncbi:hypothetical protein P9112_004298 [Eukaryota sp. TZLM1-RC]
MQTLVFPPSTRSVSLKVILHVCLLAITIFQINIPVQTSVNYLADASNTLYEYFIPEDFQEDEPIKERIYYLSSIEEVKSILDHTVDVVSRLTSSSLSVWHSIQSPMLSFTAFPGTGWVIYPDTKYPQLPSILNNNHNLTNVDWSDELLLSCLQACQYAIIETTVDHSEIVSSGALLNKWKIKQQLELIKGSGLISLTVNYDRFFDGNKFNQSTRILLTRYLLDSLAVILSFVLTFVLIVQSRLFFQTFSIELNRLKRFKKLDIDSQALVNQSSPLVKLNSSNSGKSGFLSEFFSFWTVILLLGAFFTTIGSLLDLFSLSISKYNFNNIRFLQGLGAFLTSIHACRYFESNSNLYLIITSVKRAFPQASLWFFSVLPIFLGYSLLGYSLFKPLSPFLFGTVGQSSVTLFAALNGDAVAEFFDAVYSSYPVFSRLFFYTFISLSTYCVLNVFRVIIEHAYHSTELSEEASGYELVEKPIPIPIEEIKQVLSSRFGEINNQVVSRLKK